jgi:hypothetical protein
MGEEEVRYRTSFLPKNRSDSGEVISAECGHIQFYIHVEKYDVWTAYLRGGLLREPVREQPWGDLAASSRMGMMQGDPLLDRCCVYSLQHSPQSAP